MTRAEESRIQIKLYLILYEMERELGESFQSFDRNFFSVVIKVNLLFTREGGRKLRLLFFENEKGKKKVVDKFYIRIT